MQKEFEGFRLSPQQKHLWQLHNSDTSLPYRAQCTVSIESKLDVKVLQLALEQVVNRHEILRTTFHCLPGMTLPLQVITVSGLSWEPYHDFSRCSPQVQESQLEALWHQASQQPFDFTQGPLLHLWLIRRSPSQHVLLISLPALCADAITLKNLVSEISRTYAACLQGQELNEVPLQYADLAEWHNELLEGAGTEAGRNYWLRQDLSALPVRLPFEAQTTKKAFQPQAYTVTLPPELIAKMRAVTQQLSTSVADFLLTCWQVLLWRFTQQQNLIVGVSCDGRKYAELEAPLGLFAKYLPLDCYLPEDGKFSDVLRQTQESINQAYKWQEYFTWDQLAGLTQNTPHFWPLCFEFQEQPRTHTAAAASFSIDQQSACIDRFKIKLGCIHQDKVLSTIFHYDANLFSTRDIERLAGYFQTLLASATEYPEAAISQLEILSETARQQLLVEFNNTQRGYLQDKCIHQLFEAQVEQTPYKTAVILGNQELTYGELNARANQLARYLQQLGVGPEVLVGLCLERSLDLIIGLLSILKAGGAYVPLDPAYPQERLAFMLQDVQAPVLLTQAPLVRDLPQQAGQVVCLDQDWPLVSQLAADNLASPTTAANLAYIIYTSGSTGVPKGVRITHANLCHYVQALQGSLSITTKDLYCHTASIAFSSSVRQLMLPLTQGASVIIATAEQRTNPLALFEVIKQRNITVIDIVPSYWQHCTRILSQLTSQSRKTLLDNQLRLILSASEPLPFDIPRNWVEGFQHKAQLINMFGQTETSGIATVYPIPSELDAPVKVVPLGRPIANTRVYLLDQHLQPIPIDVPGELYISSPSLGQGYLNHPALTAEKFIPNPYSSQPGDRLYKTGDQGRYLSDGNIEFLSRTDHQVKLRGYRIELGEIEAVLRQHPVVQEVVVLAREDELGQRSLTAYMVPSQTSSLTLVNDLGSFLRGRLPNYMVPAAFIMLEALPLTPNGKLDRRALLATDQARSRLVSGSLEPRTPIEEVLTGIWAQILEIEQVGIHDNFFELGGHSLLATQVISQIREAFQVELPLRSLFEAPTVAGLSDRIETAIRAGQEREIPPIQPAARAGKLPLSFAQQRLWFLDQLEPGSAAYNLARAVQLQGLLNRVALEQSFNAILQRHEALRTSFKVIEGQPVQVIAAVQNFVLPVVNLQELPKTKQQVETQRLARLTAHQPFDLTQAPLLKAILLQLEPEEHVLLFTMHHIIADGWSAGVLVREVATFYKSFSAKTPIPSLPELPIQYADFAIWQRQWLQGETLETQLDYWKQQLGGSLPVLELPTDRSRPSVQTFTGSRQSWEFPQPLTEALKILSRREGVTLFMTLLAAFKVLLYRYTGQADILVGSPIANRNRPETEKLIGFFVNTLVLRTDLFGNPSFQELLKRVRETTLRAYTHQDLPFEKLVEALQPERSLSYTPLFQVMFGLQHAPIEALKLPGLTLDVLEVEGEMARYDLTLSLTDTEPGLVGTLEYNTDLFDAATIIRMLRHFQTLLESIVTDPYQPLSNLSILTEAERRQLLVTWNSTQADYPQEQCIHQLFEVQVERTPDAVAVSFEGQQLTYQELNARANQLAHYLQRLDVRPGALVGVCVERSLEMVIGLLGILKAGGAYVPLDPAYPRERLAFMLDDAQVSVLLAQEKLIAALPGHSAKEVCLDADWEEIAKPSDRHSAKTATPEDLAYVIYTSGSTGQPKGVQICHRAVVNILSSLRQVPGLQDQDVFLSVTTLSFDIAALELFLPLTVGARMVVVSQEVAADGAQLLKRLVQSGAMAMQATPATWRLLLEAGWEGSHQLKILCGGEALPRKLANDLLKRGAALWNLYGPTEATIWSTIYQVEEEDGPVPVGRPIANTQVYILDPSLQPVPIGVLGELYIGGDGLARGYLNRPGLTGERFIQNPYGPGTRLYKTGDLARYRSDGNVEFLGRIDHQVKVRGFRIELGEVETVLNQHQAVQQSVVVTQEDKAANQCLVAYVVLSPEADLAIPHLRSWLRQKLPAYMVPAIFMLLPALPLTPNGKVDRRSLPVPETAQLNLENAFEAPRTPIEEVLATLWSQILSIKQIGVHDNFFELGGHSILATQLVSRICKVFRVELPVRCLFETPTIAGLANSIDKVRLQGGGLQTPPLLPTVRHTALPLSFAQQRLWFLDQLELGSATYNIPAAVRLMGALNIDALEHSISEVIRRHEALRTTFSVVDGRPVQVIHPPKDFRLSIIDCSTVPNPESQVQDFIWEKAQQPFALDQGPLLRVTLLRLGKADYVVLLIMHHIVSDGWSMGVLIQELAVLYEAFSTGKLSPLPELPIQYVDFAVWQRQWLQGEALAAKLTYWQQQLGGYLPTVQLPTDRPRTLPQTNRGAIQSFQFPASLSQALQRLSRQENATLFMTLLAAFQTLLHRYTHQDDILVGTDVANRNQVETEGLIGFFVNLLALRTDLSGNPRFRELLQRVREVTLGAYAHQDLPFEKLVEALRPERHENHTPLFQVLFVLQNVPMPALELPGLTLQRLAVDNGTAKFDLALFLTETQQGVTGTWQYKTDLFQAATIDRMSAHFQTLLGSIVDQPDARINALEMLTETEKTRQTMQRQERKDSRFKRFANVQPRAISLLPEKLIRTGYLHSEQPFPLVLQPEVNNVDIASWVKSNQEFLESQLLKHGAILFRDFQVDSVAAFEKLAGAICPELFEEYGDLPREGISEKVYGATPYPSDQAILFHNESSHLHCWPLKIWFCCVQPPEQGGETPIVDCRKVYQLLDPRLRSHLQQKQLMYVRNYTEGLDVSWQAFFHTTARSVVEAYCRQAGIDWEWKPEGGLRTRQIRPAIAQHPKTGETVFFNQLQLHHIACLEPTVQASLLSSFGEDNLPRHVYYGDGSAIEASVIEEIQSVYQEATTSFAWQRGDVLMLDNMLAAHGRNPYKGARKIVVAMGEMIHSADIQHRSREAADAHASS
jgi:amino acid adenylation domain-containing protein